MESQIKVPDEYLYCFNAGCPKEKDCIHHFAAEHVASSVKQGQAVFPTALQGDEACGKFKQKRLIKAAWGFSPLFEDVKERHSTILRNKIKDFLGGNGTYYRYHHGDRLLTPEQQAWILDLFSRYGYDGLHFGGYQEVWDW